MHSQASTQIAQALFDAFNAHDLDRLEALTSDGFLGIGTDSWCFGSLASSLTALSPGRFLVALCAASVDCECAARKSMVNCRRQTFRPRGVSGLPRRERSRVGRFRRP